MAEGTFVAQKEVTVAVADEFEEVDFQVPDPVNEGSLLTIKRMVKTGVKKTVRMPGEVVPEANSWPPSALDSAMSRGEIIYVSPETIEVRERLDRLEAENRELRSLWEQTEEKLVELLTKPTIKKGAANG